MKTNRSMIYKQAAAEYAHKLVTGKPGKDPITRTEVAEYWSKLALAPWEMGMDGVVCLTANFKATYEAGYRQALEDLKNGVNGHDRLPPGTPGDIGS
jgi:hypothetical protein